VSAFPGSPRLLKGGLVLVDATSGALRRTIALQYNPDTLTRSFQIQAHEAGADRSEAMRIKGPAVETIKLDAEIDATDQLEFPNDNTDATAFGVLPQLAVLETLVHPTSGQLQASEALAQVGTLEIVPMETPLALFVWSRSRVLPVRVTELSITEEAFDANLNPIRAKVSLGMRVLSVDDVGFAHRAGGLFVANLQAKEQLATKAPRSTLATFGLKGLPT
jgi:hypothetical protein